MARNKSHITTDNITEWMASTGFIFPRTILELKRFEKLYNDVQIDLTGHQIDPEVILGRKTGSKVILMSSTSEMKEETHFRMAARKGDSNIPQYILDKIKKNQDKRKQDDNGGKEESSQ